MDEIILFASLTEAQIKYIVDIQMELLQKRLAERKLSITLTEAAKDALALAGYDPVYGARPLKRAIQRQVADPLAQRLLAGTFREGDHIIIDANEEGVLSFTHQTETQETPKQREIVAA